MNPQPSQMNIIAEGNGITVSEYNGMYYIRGMTVGTSILFMNVDEWNATMAVLKGADAKINRIEKTERSKLLEYAEWWDNRRVQ